MDIYLLLMGMDHTGYRLYRQETIQSADTVYRSYSLQTIQSAGHNTIYRIKSLQTIWSVSSFLGAIGLGISFPASPEKTALVRLEYSSLGWVV